MVAYDGAESDEIDVAGGSGAEAEINVFAAVDEFFVEAAEFFPKGAANQDAGAGHRHAATVRAEQTEQEKRETE